MRQRIGVALAILVVAVAVLAAGPWPHGFRLSDVLTGGTPVLPDGSRPVAGSADLAGNATLGAGQHPATLRLTCDPAGSGLSAVLTVPRFSDFAEGFDVAGLQGAGNTAPLTGILVSNAAGVRSVRMAAQGAETRDPEKTFSLTVAGARRSEDPLRGVVLALAQTGTRLTWTQASPRAGDQTLTASFSVSDKDAAALKTALGSCLVAPPL
ncbi:hypothetical protein MKK67_00325 [Methylobacterium sp. J-072]|uniref:hypothetical protein n=1 Tax=Methylobacterium sp. J-072 TaxID=2836651 RepID=UPI001FBBFB53|nr:hypothetical protein [Methylobacterium sp. J-072]MCJ2090960.1 hypothetical protein [Methylobacterium sp. J-072]